MCTHEARFAPTRRAISLAVRPPLSWPSRLRTATTRSVCGEGRGMRCIVQHGVAMCNALRCAMQHATIDASGAPPVTRETTPMYDLIIRNGTIVDGTGAAQHVGDIAVT